jgi:CheY-like chemotaxis protein
LRLNLAETDTGARIRSTQTLTGATANEQPQRQHRRCPHRLLGARAVTDRGRILVVDDEPVVLDTLREMLQELGYDVSTAASSEQALAAMATVRPQIVFLDLLMPGISGLEALPHFREHHRRVPVIAITASMEPEIARQARAAGAFDVVGKPFDLDAIARLVAAAMRVAPRT